MHRLTREFAFAGLLLGMLMAALDLNVVLAALPKLSAELGSTGAAGVTSACLLTVAVATPLHGTLGDRFGRRRMFACSVLVFGVASLACALAPSMPVLIGARAVQGVGASGLIVSAVAGSAELFDRAELVRRQVWPTAVFAVASIGGAPVGGLLAATVGWRWIFALNLPVCVLALVFGRWLPGARARVARRLDVVGLGLIAVAGGSVVLLGSGGPAVLVLPALVCGAAFVRWELRTPDPLVPPGLFAVPGLGRAIVATGISGVALFGSVTFVPLLITAAGEHDPAVLGLALVPMTAGQLAASTGFAALAKRWPNVSAWGRAGLLLGVPGTLLVAAVPVLPDGPARTAAIIGGLALAGAALGLTMQAYTIAGQTSAPPDGIGVTMSTLTFARQVGGAFGAAAFGWLAAWTGPGWVFVVCAGVLGLAAVFAPAQPERSSSARSAAAS